MKDPDIIDVQPVQAESENFRQAPAYRPAPHTAGAAAAPGFSGPTQGQVYTHNPRTFTSKWDTAAAPSSKASHLKSLLTEKAVAIIQVVAGLVIAVAGIPLLFLPGPGLLVLFGGLALAGAGIKRLLGIRQKPTGTDRP